MSSRAEILDNVRRGLRGAAEGDAARTRAEARLATPTRHQVPARAALPHPEQVDLFVRMAEEASASVARVKTINAVPEAVAEFVLRQNLPPEIVVAPDPALSELSWHDQSRLQVEQRAGQDGDRVSVTPVFAGVAETGTLLLLSDKTRPTTLSFLPDVHIAVLRQADVVGPYEDAWDRLRQQSSGLPRSVNMITGPSRSADIEQTLQMGAHGPVQLHIVLVEE